MDGLKFSSFESGLGESHAAAFSLEADSAAKKIASAQSVADIKEQICKIWKVVGPIIKPLGNLPVVGQYIKIFAGLLDTICG